MSIPSDTNDSKRLPPLRKNTSSSDGERMESESAAWERIFRVLRGRARSQLHTFPELRKECSPEDIAQRTLTQGQRALAQFEGESEPQFFAWLFRIQDNVLQDLLRRLQRGAGAAARMRSLDSRLTHWSASDGFQTPDEGQETPSRQVGRQETLATLYEAIDTLPDDQRAIVIGRLGDATFDQISEDLGVTKTTVLRRFQKALRALKSRMGEA